MAASYAGQLYSTALVLVVTPFYLADLGASAYGLVGVFTMMQLWLQILDGGLSATLAREAARYRSGATAAPEFRALVSLLSQLFLATGTVFAIIGVLASPWVARHWFKADALPIRDVVLAVAIMVATAAIRWRTEPYRSLIVGFEDTVWLNLFTAGINSVRYIGAVAVLVLSHGSFVAFFIFQLITSVVEGAVLLSRSYKLMPARNSDAAAYRYTWNGLRPFMKFSLSVALSSSVWLIVSQFDKLLLSSILPLKTYAVFALAILASNGVSLLGMPINQAMLPRLTALKAQGNDQEFRRIYRRGTAFVAALVAPACLILVFFGGQILWVWTGNIEIARAAAPITALYALGNCVVAFMTFTYFLQYAHGDMRLHIVGNIAFIIVLIPSMLFAATRYGAIGTGFVWCVQNALYLFGWTYFIHRKLAPGLHWRWLGRDVLAVVLPSAAILALASQAPIVWYHNRFHDLMLLIALGLSCTLAGAALTSNSRETVLSLVRSVKIGRRKITRA